MRARLQKHNNPSPRPNLTSPNRGPSFSREQGNRHLKKRKTGSKGRSPAAAAPRNQSRSGVACCFRARINGFKPGSPSQSQEGRLRPGTIQTREAPRPGGRDAPVGRTFPKGGRNTLVRGTLECQPAACPCHKEKQDQKRHHHHPNRLGSDTPDVDIVSWNNPMTNSGPIRELLSCRSAKQINMQGCAGHSRSLRS